VVEVGAPTAMPCRPFSFNILAGLWPETSPDEWSDVGDGLAAKAADLENDAFNIRQTAEVLANENSGKTIDAMYEMFQRQGVAVSKCAECYQTMSGLSAG
jgi:hypothetical protein